MPVVCVERKNMIVDRSLRSLSRVGRKNRRFNRADDRRNKILRRRVLWSRNTSGGVSVQHTVRRCVAVL